MAVWETEDETDGPVSPAAAPLPTPTDTPYRTPSRASKRSMSRTSKRSRRSVTPPRPTTSPPLPGTDRTDKTDKSSKRSSRDLATDDTISILDPRRFTPTLHANLVSEILSLRRDQEEKLKIIESLETALHTSREEQEFLQDTATTNAKETRSLKRQLALLEGGTSSAIGELSRERDEAAETANETRKRLDAAQKKVRHHEEDSERTHQQWAREKEAWDDEKRKLERKIHVAESRLKMVLDEFAALHSPATNGMNGANGVNGNGTDSEAEDGVPAGKESDVASVRTMSMTNSIRFSLMSVRANMNAHSLADELNFDGDSDWDTDNGGRDSVLSNFHNRTQSRDSIMSRTHCRNQSNDSLRRSGSVARGRFLNQTVLERLEGVAIPEDEEDQTVLAADEPTETTAESDNESAPESIAETIVEPVTKQVDEIVPEPVVVPMVPKVEYTDSAVQYSPPPSPKLPPQPLPDLAPVPELPSSPVRSRPDRSSVDSLARGECSEIEANQRRKRVHIARPLTIEPVILGGSLMVSVGSQTTLEEPLTPPKTPKYPPFEKEQPEEAVVKPEPIEMVTNSTQTDPVLPPTPPLPPLSPTSPISLSQIAIPSISIHPPTSRPTTPGESLLPPLFKDFGCQVQISYAAPSKSVSVQTEEIRVDMRLDRLPPHLHPSAISSRPSSPGAIIADPAAAAVDDLSKQPAPAYVPPRNPRRLAASARVNSDPPSSPPAPLQSSFILEEEPETHDAYPGNNDDGPLSSQQAPMRRPHRISSLFAGFDGISSDEADEFLEGDLSDLEFRTALSAPKPKVGGSSSRANGKRNPSLASVPGSPVSPDQITSLPRRSSTRNSERSSAMSTFSGTETYSKFSLADSRNSREYSTGRRMSIKGSRLSYEKGSGIGSGNRSSVMRKAAMIQNGIATHQGRARSPSLTDPRDPPFPIPTRASSRRPPLSVSAPSDGQRSPTRGDWPRQSVSRGHYRAGSIRKVRSAAAIPVKPRSIRRGSRASVQRASILLDEEPESPSLPPLPDNDITSSRMNHGVPQRSRHRREMSTTTANTAITANTEQTNGSATGVVDAIAQTMVGEWMYKYVRRRKSFGVGDAPNRDDSSNDRHRRWVWLAPYERAILWSSKQPSNNSMLMGGKSGRKLTIQSVLDVKDDNPAPKGCPQLFNRSILILTPQRALKFTATTAERHYLWLTSLSFLAHSQQAVPENIAVTLPKAAPDFEPPRPPRPRKNGIRDSIRLTKSKGAVIQSVQSGSAVLVQQVPPLPPMSIASSQTDSMPPSIPSYRPAESTMSAPSVAATSTSAHQRDISRDTAEPPAIQRFHDRANQALVHGRKRSNTGGHVPPPLSFRGFSGPSSGSYHHASTNSTAGNSDISQSVASTNVTWGMVNGMMNGMNGTGTLSSQRTSEASSRPSGAVMNNFFDAIGTVRMEAFISPLTMPQFEDYPDEQEEMRYRARRRSKEIRRRASRSRHRDSYHSRGTRGTDEYYAGSRTGGEEDYFRDDPFKGF